MDFDEMIMNLSSKIYRWGYIDGLVQEKRNSIANALEICLSCTNPSIQDKEAWQALWDIKSINISSLRLGDVYICIIQKV